MAHAEPVPQGQKTQQNRPGDLRDCDVAGNPVGSVSSTGLRSSFVIYQDPLAYLPGLEGIALLDAWVGDHDRAFTDARLAEIRRLLDDEKLRDRSVFAEQVSTVFRL
jgi:hypothetical protein